MAKRSQRRQVQHEKHQSGCMWGLISMLDFRRTRSNQKLLPDRRRGSGRHSGLGHSKSKTEWSDLDDNPQSSLGGAESKKMVLNSAIVKILIEEEMVNEQGMNQEISKSTLDFKQSSLGPEGQRKKDCKRNRKSSSKSLDFEINDLKEVESRCSCNNKIEQDSADNVMDIMEEFCRHIHETSAGSARNGHSVEVHQKLDLAHSAIEEKLCAAVKELLKKQVICHEDLLENEEIQCSKEFKNVLQILNSDDVSILELLRDQNSVLVNYIQSFQESCLERDRMSNNSNLPEHNESNHKHRNFFRMKSKSQEAKSTRVDDNSQAYNKIIILKPGLLEVPKPEMQTGLSQSSQLESVNGKSRAEKMHNHYFLHDLKRKLKNVLGKDHSGMNADGRVKKLSKGGENMRSAANKDRFYIEKVARPSYGAKRVEKNKMSKTKNEVVSETSSGSEQRMSNIYIEAKKHLAEILNGGNGQSNSLRRKHQNTLGKIISDREVHISPILSPGREWKERMVTAQMRFSAGVGHQKANSTRCSCMEGSKNNCPGIPSCGIEADSSDVFNAEMHKHDVDQDALYDHLLDNEVKETAATPDRTESEDTSIGLATEVDCTTVDSCFIPSGSSGIDNYQQQHLPNTSREYGFAECLEKDPQDIEHPFSSSPPYSSILNDVNDPETTIDKPEQPSPVSVLERIYIEDDTSPTRTIGQAGMMQPLHIKIQEDDLRTIDEDGYTRNCLEDIEQILEYVNALLEGCGLDWDILYLHSHGSDELIEPSLINDVEFFGDNDYDRKLIFDCTNEVLWEVCESNVSHCPLVSFAKPGIVTVSNTKEVIREVCKGFSWYLLPPPLPRTLEQIVRKDMSKTGSWLELSLETEIIGFEVSDAVLDELVEDTILSFLEESSKGDYPISLDE